MVQVINDPYRSRGASLGNAFGEGLAEQLPKEIERYRLSNGLKNLMKNAPNQDPMQTFAEFVSIPGVIGNPQLMHTFGGLINRQMQGKSLKDYFNNQQQSEPSTIDKETPSPFPGTENLSKNDIENSRERKYPSLTTHESFSNMRNLYIPKTEDDIINDASRRYSENPGLYKNDPDIAIETARRADQIEQNRSKSKMEQHGILTSLQDDVVNRLREFSNRLNAQVPADIFSKVEDEAINATKSKEEGGEGLDSQQAMKKYGEKLDKISREYDKINSIGNWGIVTKKPSEILNSMKSLREKFASRNDLRNYAQTLMSSTQITPEMSYSQAYPVNKYPELNDVLKDIPDASKNKNMSRQMPGWIPRYGALPPQEGELKKETLRISKKIFDVLGDASPLSVSYELNKKGYPADIWIDYLIENKSKLKNFSAEQEDQLGISTGAMFNLNDYWLKEWTGIK